LIKISVILEYSMLYYHEIVEIKEHILFLCLIFIDDRLNENFFLLKNLIAIIEYIYIWHDSIINHQLILN